jgi:hypothetical protein
VASGEGAVEAVAVGPIDGEGRVPDGRADVDGGVPDGRVDVDDGLGDGRGDTHASIKQATAAVSVIERTMSSGIYGGKPVKADPP